MSKEAYYFSHDSNARTDPKMLQMRSVYKSEGYGWFWILIEMMRDQEDYALDMQGKYVWNAFAKELDATAEKIEAFVTDCICEFKLFESDGTKFWSNSLKERMKVKVEKSEKARKSAEARWNKPSIHEEEMQPQCDGNANASKNDAIKESKGKEIKDNIYSFWNEQQIIVHKTLTDKMSAAINKAIKNKYTEVDIKLAIENYSRILRGEQYYFNYKWSLDDFLNRGLSKFLDWNVCESNFKKTEPIKETRANSAAYEPI